MAMINSMEVVNGCHKEGIYDLLDILETLLRKYEDEPISFDYCGVSITCQPSKDGIPIALSMWASAFCRQAFDGRHIPEDSWWFFVRLIEHRPRWGVTYTTAANEVIGLIAQQFQMSQSQVLEMLDRQLKHRWLLPRCEAGPGKPYLWYEELVRWITDQEKLMETYDQNRQFC